MFWLGLRTEPLWAPSYAACCQQLIDLSSPYAIASKSVDVGFARAATCLCYAVGGYVGNVSLRYVGQYVAD